MRKNLRCNVCQEPVAQVSEGGIEALGELLPTKWKEDKLAHVEVICKKCFDKMVNAGIPVEKVGSRLLVVDHEPSVDNNMDRVDVVKALKNNIFKPFGKE